MVENNIDIGLLIKKSFKSIRYDPGYIALFLPIVLIMVIFSIAMNMLVLNDLLTMSQSFMSQSPSDISKFTNLLQEKMWILIVIISLYVISLIIISALVYASVIKKVESQEKGEKISVSEAFSRGFSIFPRLLATTLLVALVVIAPVVVFVVLLILGVISNIVALVCFSLLVMIVLIILLVYFAIRLSLFAPACVIDNLGPMDSLKRSWHITKGNVLLIFVTAIIIGIIALAITAPFIAINTVTSTNQLNPVGSVANIVGQAIAQLIIAPVSIIIYTLIYLDLSKKYMIKTGVGKKETFAGPAPIQPQ